MFVTIFPVGEFNVGFAGTAGLKLMLALHGPDPPSFHVCTFQVYVPALKPGVAPATEQVAAQFAWAAEYHVLSIFPDGPSTHRKYQVEPETAFHV